MFPLAALVACLAPRPVVPAPTVDGLGDLGDTVQTVYEAHQVPALAGVIGNSQGALAIGATGLRSNRRESAVTNADKWHHGSNTKAMTATTIALLVDEGRLSWDATIPTLFAGTNIHEGWSAVTLADLLHHRGGADDAVLSVYPELQELAAKAPTACEGRAALASELLAQAPTARVGEFNYSNTGYILAGAAMELATGRCWEELITEHLFEPLGMASCGFGPPLGTTPHGEPVGHRITRGGRAVPVKTRSPRSDNPAFYGPAGTVHCDLVDFGRFAAFHLRAARKEGAELSDEAIQQLHTPVGDYAMGFLVVPTRSGPLLQHAGSNTMWYSQMSLLPDADLFLLTTVNAAGDDAIAAAQELETEMLLRALSAE